MKTEWLWLLAVVVGIWAGVLDWRFRRIPNWLTVGGLGLGLVLNVALAGWRGAVNSLLGLGLGLGLLLPFYLLRAMGGGDWKLAGALGGIVGPNTLLDVLMVAVLVAGVMAVVLIITKGRVQQTLRNIANMLASLARLQMPGPEVSLDNPDSARVPFGVSVAIAVTLMGARVAWQAMGRR
jgi:prepilin peptidase CpaA